MVEGSERVDPLGAEIERLRARIERLERMSRRRTRADRLPLVGLGVAVVFLAVEAWAIDVPFLFVNGQVADANQVNANFQLLADTLTAHLADPGAHHAPITSVDGLSGGTIAGVVTVSDRLEVPAIQPPGASLSITSSAGIEISASTTIDLNGATITLN